MRGCDSLWGWGQSQQPVGTGTRRVERRMGESKEKGAWWVPREHEGPRAPRCTCSPTSQRNVETSPPPPNVTALLNVKSLFVTPQCRPWCHPPTRTALASPSSLACCTNAYFSPVRRHGLLDPTPRRLSLVDGCRLLYEDTHGNPFRFDEDQTRDIEKPGRTFCPAASSL